MSWRSTSLILLIVLYLAPVVAPVHAEEDQVTRRLVIDGSFVGDRPTAATGAWPATSSRPEGC